jgi:serine/threonine protein kinase
LISKIQSGESKGALVLSYFYAMEFVEGETLENLIRRCGQLDGRLTLEIAGQVAAGLAAVHKQNLVHRDIKQATSW